MGGRTVKHIPVEVLGGFMQKGERGIEETRGEGPPAPLLAALEDAIPAWLSHHPFLQQVSAKLLEVKGGRRHVGTEAVPNA